ncbi:hypothetical protein HDC92_000958 [Pedobacter sp. AK017]|uniref:hypothetical protein n=1 Tax=Pedobacter sp. AK017 TaxID=2723073 RepID=UPI001619D122|nr:hypothetical protein [Pedobacter sp. AK017]MBB5437290.1 hypothetical protein [Pedobacter sp. AK017]
MNKKQQITVKGIEISIFQQSNNDYISLTGIALYKDRGRSIEFDGIKSQSGLHSYKLSVKEWSEKTNAIGLKTTAGGNPFGRLALLREGIKKFTFLLDKDKLLFTFVSLGYQRYSLTKTSSQHEME